MDVERLLAREEHVVLEVADGDHGQRLDRFLAARLRFASRSRACAWVRGGAIAVDGCVMRRPARPVRAGERLELCVPKTPRDLSAPWGALAELHFAHEGHDWLAVEKPAGVPSHPAGGVIKRTLLTAVAVACSGRYEEGGPWLPHRLDRETSGLVVVALSRAAQRRFTAAFQRGRIRRFYTAHVHGAIDLEPATVLELDYPLRALPTRPRRVAVERAGKPALTRVSLASNRADAPHLTALDVEPVTGRQHQIRVHLAHHGHPIVGDALYGPEIGGGGRMHLHASALLVPGDVAGGGDELLVQSRFGSETAADDSYAASGELPLPAGREPRFACDRRPEACRAAALRAARAAPVAYSTATRRRLAQS
jgi:23S rRNA pseudouridine1911/1915/1917 synthase